jgi:hypothetical protein
MDDSITITSRFGKILSVGTALIVAGGLASIVISSGFAAVARYGWPLVFIGFAAWALFWQPRLMITGGGVTLYNVLRTVYVPWGAIREIDTKYALTLLTATEAGAASYTAWAAPAPTRYSVRSVNKQELRLLPESTFLAETIRPGDVPSTDSGYAAQLIRTRWEDSRAHGNSGSELLEQRIVTRRHWRTIAVGSVLVAAAIASVVVQA